MSGIAGVNNSTSLAKAIVTFAIYSAFNSSTSSLDLRPYAGTLHSQAFFYLSHPNPIPHSHSHTHGAKSVLTPIPPELHLACISIWPATGNRRQSNDYTLSLLSFSASPFFPSRSHSHSHSLYLYLSLPPFFLTSLLRLYIGLRMSRSCLIRRVNPGFVIMMQHRDTRSFFDGSSSKSKSKSSSVLMTMIPG